MLWQSAVLAGATLCAAASEHTEDWLQSALINVEKGMYQKREELWIHPEVANQRACVVYEERDVNCVVDASADCFGCYIEPDTEERVDAEQLRCPSDNVLVGQLAGAFTWRLHDSSGVQGKSFRWYCFVVPFDPTLTELVKQHLSELDKGQTIRGALKSKVTTDRVLGAVTKGLVGGHVARKKKVLSVPEEEPTSASGLLMKLKSEKQTRQGFFSFFSLQTLILVGVVLSVLAILVVVALLN